MVRIRMKVVKITRKYRGFEAEDDTALDRPVYFTTKMARGPRHWRRHRSYREKRRGK